jgi:hypothetical protein
LVDVWSVKVGIETTARMRSLERQIVTELAIVAVEAASRDGGMIAAQDVAQRLLTDHPACSMKVLELRDQIVQMALNRGVGIEFSERG